MADQAVHFDGDSLKEICRRYGVRRLSFFGSVLTDRFSPTSDLDVLAEFDPGETPSLMTLGGLQQELAALFGREVDLKTPGFLSRHFRDEVIRSARLQYAA